MLPRFDIWGLIIFAPIVLLYILSYWKIFSKAGYPGWLGLLQFIPVINIFIIFFLAFSKWPIHQELERIKTGNTPC